MGSVHWVLVYKVWLPWIELVPVTKNNRTCCCFRAWGGRSSLVLLLLWSSLHNFAFCRYLKGGKGGATYPNTVDGDLDHVGSGCGQGYNVNCCLTRRGPGDADYFAIWDHLVLPLIEKYSPEMILISAGFDAGRL